MNRLQSEPQCASMLRGGGFSPIGRWIIDPVTGGARIEGDFPKHAGIYAHLVAGKVVYIGSAQRGLHARMRRYSTSRTMRTSQRVREAATAEMLNGHGVEVWALVIGPRTLALDGLPIDLVCGIEEGLIRKLRPSWNRRGLGVE